MKSLYSYVIIIFLFAFLCFFYSWRNINNALNIRQLTDTNVVSQAINVSRFRNGNRDFDISYCNMATCFDWEKCKTDKVFVYPMSIDSPISPLYNKVLKALRESYFYTENPDEACLMVLSIDTTDRDKISENYVKNIDEQIQRLPSMLWNRGRNHLIFNFYSGSYPNYEYNLGFETGQAMIAWASSNSQFFRPNFDVSFPLFHKEHSFRTLPNRIDVALLKRDRYLASFKGKRYVFGIGSETRNILYKLNDDDRFVIATTCKHTVLWKKFEDDRCSIDNENYDKWNYTELLQNSTFCFTPRGRRLGSFRFLEALGAGCIPVVLSDDWLLPFSEFIDWSSVVVQWPESDVFFLADYLMEMTDAEISERKLKSLLLYHRFFSSVEHIVHSTVRNVLDRVSHQRRGWETVNWNAFLDYDGRRSAGHDKYAAVVLANSQRPTQLGDIVKSLAIMQNIKKIIVFCAVEFLTYCRTIANETRMAVTVSRSVYVDDFLMSYDLNAGETDFFLFYDERNGALDMSELHAAMRLIEEDPASLLTFHALNHKKTDFAWTLDAEPDGPYSFATLHKTIVHRDIVEHFRQHQRKGMAGGCATVLFNIAFAQRTLRSPQLIASSRSRSPMLTTDFYIDLGDTSRCFGEIVRDMYDNHVPLISSSVRYSL